MTKENEQKSIVIDVKMPRGEKCFALEFDKRLRECTQSCRTSALYQGIARGDEVYFIIDRQDRFSYLKQTGQKFNLKDLPKPASAIIDADQPLNVYIVPEEPPKVIPPKFNEERMVHEIHRGEIIHWQAIINSAIHIETICGHGMDDDVEKAVEATAEKLHAFIMEKVK